VGGLWLRYSEEIERLLGIGAGLGENRTQAVAGCKGRRGSREKRNGFAFGKRGMSTKTKTKADHLIVAEPLGQASGAFGASERDPCTAAFLSSWGAAG
jgi:hypothetical protein